MESFGSLLSFLGVVLLAVSSAEGASGFTEKELAFFESKVRPLLIERCYECHSHEAAKLKGGLFLDSRGGWTKGGDNGPAIVPGDPERSLLIKAVRSADENLQMPPKKMLSQEQVAVLVEWVKMGAPDPRESGTAPKAASTMDIEQRKKFWSFQPLKKVEPPPVRDSSWVRTPIDRFILAKLEAEGIRPNPPVDKRKLIRRAYLDLIGLPPKPEEIDEFLNDTSAGAYEKLIDRLLANPHYGERWGRHWLDLARFGESHGYEQDYDRPFAYRYRDFVIQALNDDLPYDQFVKWQIAGDELAPDEPEAWKATGFLAAGTHATQITANQAEKERYDELDDKINTIGTAMLGLTIGCARCHDHKFDPIPTVDYYRLIATFTTTVRSDYDVDLNPRRTRELKAAFDREHQPLVEALAKFEKEPLPSRFEAWLARDPQLPSPAWLTLEAENVGISSAYYGISSAQRQNDDSYLVKVTAGMPNTYTFTARTPLTNITAIRLEALTHDTLPNRGPGWKDDGDFALSDLELTVAPIKEKDAAKQKAKLAEPMATCQEPDSPVAAAIDSDRSSAWRVTSRVGEDHAAIFQLERPVGFEGGTALNFTLRFISGDEDRHNLGRFRLAITTSTTLPALSADHFPHKTFIEAQKALAIAPNQRAEAQTQALSQIYRTTDSQWRQLHEAVQAHLKVEPHPRLVKATVASEGLPAIRLHTQGPDFYEKTFLLKRGDPAQKQTEASPGFLEVLMRAPEKSQRWQCTPPRDARTPHLRAALADWIADVYYGAGSLLARVIVNRLWQHHMGHGIVATPSDFGSTGAPPTHPELLDWLANQLIEHGWKLKPLHKAIMLSGVYMQGTENDETRAKADPENRLFWHRPRQRLEAEVIRDSILAVSGQLSLRIFGPGSLDEGMNRRSIYFTVKRSKLIPWMVQFDWPDSLQSLGLRATTTVPPQALLMMNNPHVRKAAQRFSDNLTTRTSKPSEQVALAYRTALGRPPTEVETRDSLRFLENQANAYTSEGRAAPEPLALADFCQTVLSLNEFIYVD
ncbi:MAG: PSD1 domain-containing protein [Verrucomicrobia bacterium]|nr:PSD1 domain-containing protein [Verrucomicrobiota bacterium]